MTPIAGLPLRAAALLAALVPAFLPSTGIAAQEAQSPTTQADKGEFCIPLIQIDRTEVIDNRTILVRMKGGQQDRKITLANACPGLRFNGFVHETSINQLCRSDPLRVIETNGGGSVCAIQSITPVTKAEADALEKRG